MNKPINKTIKLKTVEAIIIYLYIEMEAFFPPPPRLSQTLHGLSSYFFRSRRVPGRLGSSPLHSLVSWPPHEHTCTHLGTSNFPRYLRSANFRKQFLLSLESKWNENRQTNWSCSTSVCVFISWFCLNNNSELILSLEENKCIIWN